MIMHPHVHKEDVIFLLYYVSDQYDQLLYFSLWSQMVITDIYVHTYDHVPSLNVGFVQYS